jgi:hypothetical protein
VAKCDRIRDAIHEVRLEASHPENRRLAVDGVLDDGRDVVQTISFPGFNKDIVKMAAARSGPKNVDAIISMFVSPAIHPSKLSAQIHSSRRSFCEENEAIPSALAASRFWEELR